MPKRQIVRLVGAVILVLLLVIIPAAATSLYADEGWQATYWNNTSLSGAPVLQRPEAVLDNDWGFGSPGPGVNNDYFSARWTRTLNLEPGRYRFIATADDGVRLWVNNTLILDAWQNQVATSNVVYIDVPGGDTPVRMEYYDNQHHARARLMWAKVLASQVLIPDPQPAATIQAWRGEYYKNKYLLGTPVMVRDDAQIDFDWGLDSPDPHFMKLWHEFFSVRWTNTLNLESGRYRFTATVDDGVRLWVNNQLLIDRWDSHTVISFSGEIDLPGGPTPVKMEYYDEVGLAEAHLTWTKVGAASPPAPAQIEGPAATVINANRLNVRSGPGITNTVISSLSGGQMVAVVGRNTAATWIQVVLPDGRTGWSSAAYLSADFPFTDLAITE